MLTTIFYAALNIFIDTQEIWLDYIKKNRKKKNKEKTLISKHYW